VRRGDFPPLRGTAAWEEAQEARRTKILAAVVIVLFFAAMMLGGCNGSHGRC
jgi:hypothetical protein